uniref:FLYWCH-type domain-containing protein n=1 Tax=Cacopsylla melanoneura TaxID=428564 RepID=A0A8D8X167_9HEMI
MSEKQHPLILHEGNKFTFHKNLKHGLQRWRCSQTNCKSHLKVFEGVLIDKMIDHNHPKLNETTLRRQLLNAHLKEMALETSIEPNKLVGEVLDSSGIENLSKEEMIQLRKSVQRHRRVMKLQTQTSSSASESDVIEKQTSSSTSE